MPKNSAIARIVRSCPAVLNVKLQHLGQWAEDRQRNADRYRAEFVRLGLDRGCCV